MAFLIKAAVERVNRRGLKFFSSGMTALEHHLEMTIHVYSFGFLISPQILPVAGIFIKNKKKTRNVFKGLGYPHLKT